MPKKTKTKKKKKALKPKPKPKPKKKPKKKKKAVKPKAVSAAATASPVAAPLTVVPAPIGFTAMPLNGPILGAVLPGLVLPAAPPAGPMPPGVEVVPNFAWENYGQNLATPVGTLYRLSNGPNNVANDGLKAIQWAVRTVAAGGGGGSASGSRWSFSPVAMNAASIFEVRMMAKRLSFAAADLANPAELASLVQVQAGTTIEKLISYAEGLSRDLKAMGGNCGQTVAGAISTGTKGGFIGQPGFPDMARALYLVAEDGSLHWIERASRPVLSAAAVAAYQAGGVKVHNSDDALFNHAVVSLGAFGLVYAVVLETAPAYFIKLSRAPVDFDATVDKQTFDRDFGDFAEPVLDFATVVNPYRMSLQNGVWRGNGVGTAVRTVVHPAPMGAPPPPGGNVNHPINDADLAQILAAFAAGVPPLVAPLVDQLISATYGAREAQGPMSVAYPLSLTHAPTLGMELGVPGPRARELFGIILDYIHEKKAQTPLPGILAIRQTIKSAATLSMAKWDATTTIEFGCLRVNGTERLLGGLLERLDQQPIPFTVHLGMLHGLDASGQSWLTRQRLERLFGGSQAISDWVAARKTINPKGTVFTNPLTKALGLTS